TRDAYRNVYIRSDRSIPCACRQYFAAQCTQHPQSEAGTSRRDASFRGLAVWRLPCMVGLGLVRVSYVRVDDRSLARPPSRSGGWVVDHAGFRRLVDMEVQKAQRLRYSLAVLCIAAGRNGSDMEPSAAPLLAQRATPLFRSTDAVVSWSSSS